MSVGVSFIRRNEVGRYAHCWWHHSLGWDTELYNKEENELRTNTCCCVRLGWRCQVGVTWAIESQILHLWNRLSKMVSLQHAHVHTHACTHAHVHALTHIHTHKHSHRQTHTQTYTHTHHFSYLPTPWPKCCVYRISEDRSGRDH